MSVYSSDDEERIRCERAVHEWARSGLLGPSQRDRLLADVSTRFRRTNVYLRIGLALFTWLIVGATTGFVLATLNPSSEQVAAIVMAIAAAVAFAAARWLAREQRLYRFGVEEALAVGAATLGSAAVMVFLGAGRTPERVQIAAGLATAAAASGGLYAAFGLVYAGCTSIAFVAGLPFAFDLSLDSQVMLALLVLTAGFLLVRSRLERYRNDYRGDDYRAMQAVAWLGIYLLLQVRLFSTIPPGGAAMHWLAIAGTSLLPPFGLWLAVRDRDRLWLDVNIAAAVFTLVRVKTYVGLTVRPWDPILLGAFLIATALGVRRWLSRGADAGRNGFTADRILDRERRGIGLVATASAFTTPVSRTTPPEAAPSSFDGGRSGGGGAGATY